MMTVMLLRQHHAHRNADESHHIWCRTPRYSPWSQRCWLAALECMSAKAICMHAHKQTRLTLVKERAFATHIQVQPPAAVVVAGHIRADVVADGRPKGGAKMVDAAHVTELVLPDGFNAIEGDVVASVDCKPSVECSESSTGRVMPATHTAIVAEWTTSCSPTCWSVAPGPADADARVIQVGYGIVGHTAVGCCLHQHTAALSAGMHTISRGSQYVKHS